MYNSHLFSYNPSKHLVAKQLLSWLLVVTLSAALSFISRQSNISSFPNICTTNDISICFPQLDTISFGLLLLLLLAKSLRKNSWWTNSPLLSLAWNWKVVFNYTFRANKVKGAMRNKTEQSWWAELLSELNDKCLSKSTDIINGRNWVICILYRITVFLGFGLGPNI